MIKAGWRCEARGECVITSETAVVEETLQGGAAESTNTAIKNGVLAQWTLMLMKELIEECKFMLEVFFETRRLVNLRHCNIMEEVVCSNTSINIKPHFLPDSLR